MIRRNPAPDASWSESVEYNHLSKLDRVRGGARDIVWRLVWVDAPPDAPLETRATEFALFRELGGLQFNERMLRTTFLTGRTTMLKSGWGSWGKYGTDRHASFYGDYDQRSLDDNDMRKIGLAGYMVLQRMMERVRELEAGKKKRR